ncbi:MAG TPA: polysaccharide deacetylase family protein [Gaiellales bacterium]
MGRALAAVACAATAAYASPGLGAVGRLRYPGVVRRLEGRRDAVALTFDDGPHPAGTPAVLGELDRHSLVATFYVVAARARRHPAELREVVAAGHQLGLHGGPHLPHALLPPLVLEHVLERARAEIEQLAGAEVRSLRAPFGAASLATLRYAARAGLPLVSWSRWGRDWKRRAAPDAIARRVAGGLEAGDILLLHDSDAYSARGSWERTVAALPEIAGRIRDAGLQTVTVR